MPHTCTTYTRRRAATTDPNEIEALEAAAERAAPGSAARAFNRAGDHWLGAGDTVRALRGYGKAIDAHLEAGRYTAAAGMCRKILRIAPGAVRTRCTLAWLAVGRGDADEARREIGAYASAALHPEQNALAVANLRMMAQTTHAPVIRALVADALTTLAAADDAALVMRGQPETAPPRPTAAEQAQLWASVVAAATRGPADQSPL